ncbi:hypothetical protein [Mesorhizobium sp.]|uniref:hypothetical protein n=1 Tax=Mesorhizobium sp. TaxID=1871066 RepID=UPI000FE5C97E|nr:hypothetical protein [Mesorhizobium sp.]RWO88576.1 MAG: hypothetical protein EOQ95_18410 [Mesorhizobium sp.]
MKKILSCAKWFLPLSSSVVASAATASETAILKGIREDQVTTGAEIIVPEPVDEAPAMGASETSVNPLINITAAEERLIVDKIFPLSAAKWPFKSRV